jgi:hypothetical protein
MRPFLAEERIFLEAVSNTAAACENRTLETKALVES